MSDWTTEQTLTFIVLLFPTLSAILIPVLYIPKANLRDPLARAIAAVSLVVALSFSIRCVVSATHYSGYEPGLDVWHWSARLVYLCAGIAHALIIVSLWRALHPKRGSYHE